LTAGGFAFLQFVKIALDIFSDDGLMPPLWSIDLLQLNPDMVMICHFHFQMLRFDGQLSYKIEHKIHGRSLPKTVRWTERDYVFVV
jgi:hypothetical protein